jgi:hypothetical protein
MTYWQQLPLQVYAGEQVEQLKAEHEAQLYPVPQSEDELQLKPTVSEGLFEQ